MQHKLSAGFLSGSENNEAIDLRQVHLTPVGCVLNLGQSDPYHVKPLRKLDRPIEAIAETLLSPMFAVMYAKVDGQRIGAGVFDGDNQIVV